MTSSPADYETYYSFANDIASRYYQLIVPLIVRIEAANPPLEIREAISKWQSAHTKFSQAIAQRFRVETLFPLLSNIEEFSTALVNFADKKTQLEVSEDVKVANKISAEFALKNAEYRRNYTNENSLPNDSPAEWSDGPHTSEVRLLRDAIEGLERRVSNLKSGIEIGEKNFSTNIEPLQKAYAKALAGLDASLPELRAKSDQIDDMLEFTSKKVLTGTYQDQANLEKTAANQLRTGALGTMAVALILVAFSFISSTRADHVLENTILRLVFSLALAVPAAYMARESAKHRQQQYALQQTALDVATIDPYINNLPDSIQHQIKIDVASKIFGARNFDHIGKESFPLSTQDIITKLIDAVASRRSEEKSAKNSTDET